MPLPSQGPGLAFNLQNKGGISSSMRFNLQQLLMGSGAKRQPASTNTTCTKRTPMSCHNLITGVLRGKQV